MAKYKKRKDGRYATTICLGYKQDGKPINKTVYGHTIRELETKLNEYKIEIGKGTDFTKQSLTFKEYRDKWWEAKQIAIDSIGTKNMYKNVFTYLTPLDYIQLKEVSSNDIQALINKKKHQPRTCQKIKLVVNQIFKKAIAERILSYNPCDAVVIPKYQSQERRPLTDDENFLTELDIFTDRERAYLQLIKYTGIRKEEALALTKDDFNLLEQRLTISKAIAFDGNKSYLKSTKNGSTRILPIPNNIFPFISYYVSNLESDLLFTNLTSNTYMTNTGYRRMWESIINKLEDAGKKMERSIGDDLTAHIFRHNYACMLMYAKVDMKERQYLLGHKTIGVTMNIYTHIETHKTQASNLLNKYLANC